MHSLFREEEIFVNEYFLVLFWWMLGLNNAALVIYCWRHIRDHRLEGRVRAVGKGKTHAGMNVNCGQECEVLVPFRCLLLGVCVTLPSGHSMWQGEQAESSSCPILTQGTTWRTLTKERLNRKWDKTNIGKFNYVFLIGLQVHKWFTEQSKKAAVFVRDLEICCFSVSMQQFCWSKKFLFFCFFVISVLIIVTAFWFCRN